MHSSTWNQWIQFFAQNGYESLNPDWPGDGATVEESRANTKVIANHGVKEVADSYAKVIASLPSKPILIGHSFGGLIVRLLLGRGIASARIAIDPAPIKGVWQLPYQHSKLLSRPSEIRLISPNQYLLPINNFDTPSRIMCLNEKQRNSMTGVQFLRLRGLFSRLRLQH